MAQCNVSRIAHLAGLCIIGLTLLTTTIGAQTVKVEGLIKGRSGPEMIVQTSATADIVILLTDSTDVGQVQGILKARKKEMSMAALIPGLKITVEGAYNDQHQLVAEKVRFKGNDLQSAQAIEAVCTRLKRKFSRTKKNWKGKGLP